MQNGTTATLNGSRNGSHPGPVAVEEHDLLWDGLPPATTQKLGEPLDEGLVSHRKGRGGRTFAYLEGREHAPQGEAWEAALPHWRSFASDADARYDDVAEFAGEDIEPMVTWGIHPGQSVGVHEPLPDPTSFDEADRPTVERAYAHMGFRPGQTMTGVPIDVAFIGSCTNARLSDLRTAAALARGRRVAEGVKAIVVPGSQAVKKAAEEEGLDRVFTEAGFEWRHAGCSMCLGMNSDKLVGDQICASTSNRNFIGRQGSPRGRTLLMSPSMATAAALEGRVSDARALT